MNRFKDRRPQKRTINHIRKKAAFGRYVIDCRWHPCVVVGTYFESIDVKSLVTGTTFGCSLVHCGIEPISQKTAEEMRDYILQFGFYEYLKKYRNYSEQDIEEYKEHERVWGFEKVES